VRQWSWKTVLMLCAAGLPLLAQAQANISAGPIPRSLTLEMAEGLLLERNQAIATSRYQLEVNQALRRIAGYKPNPVVHIGMEQVPVKSPVPGSVPRFFATNSDAGANPVYTSQVTKIIERGGKREIRVQQADALVEASRAQILDTFRTQLFQLRQAFTNAIQARENLRLAETIDAQYVETERLTNVRFEAGDVAAVELFRARAARLPYRQAVLDAQTAYQQAVRDILNLLNLRPDDTSFLKISTEQPGPGIPVAQSVPASIANVPIQIQGQFAMKLVVPAVEELRQLALNERPDVIAARNTLRAAERGMALARAQRTRDIAVGAEYQRVGDDHSVGMIAEFPLFVYNNQKAAIAHAAAQQRAAEAQLRQAETQAITDVEKAYQAYLAAQRSLAIYSGEGLATTEKMRSVMEFSYQRGEASLFELLDAQRTASQAGVAANQARAAYALATWQLEQAIGRPLP
jgi:outer membrane protein, heavy metal efflux system